MLILLFLANSVLDDVYARLTETIGIAQPPTLRVCTEKCSFGVAQFVPDRMEIEVSTTITEICGKPCVAAVLAHELGHFDQWRHGRIAAGTDFVLPEGVPAAGRKQLEADADLYGGMLGQRAGFDTVSVMPSVLDAVYAKITPDAKSYPTLDERKRIASASAVKLARLSAVFRAANVLLAAGQDLGAATCFDHVAASFESREILNDAAVARARAVEARMPDAEKPWPWVLDTRSRLEPGLTASRGAATVDPAKLLEIAARLLQRARDMDAGYWPAILNLAGVATLQGKRGTAEDLMAEAKKKGAPAEWAAAKSNCSAGEWKPEHESIEGVSPDAMPDMAAGERITSEDGITVSWAMSEGAWVALSIASSRGTMLRAVGTLPGYRGATNEGIHTGASEADVIKAYGCPAARVRTTAGEMLVYRQSGLVLEVGTRGVEGWWIYTAK